MNVSFSQKARSYFLPGNKINLRFTLIYIFHQFNPAFTFNIPTKNSIHPYQLKSEEGPEAKSRNQAQDVIVPAVSISRIKLIYKGTEQRPLRYFISTNYWKSRTQRTLHKFIAVGAAN